MASEYLKWKYRDVKPDEPVVLTRKQKWENWWHYHKWHIILGGILIFALVDIAVHMLGMGVTEPDYQFGCIASYPLPEETISALETAFASLAPDRNGDGKMIVRCNQYPETDSAADTDAAMYAYASQVRLMADLQSGDSQFFLLENPETFQEKYEILSEESPLLWRGCPVLASLPLGEFTESILDQTTQGSNQALLADFYLLRRDDLMNDETVKTFWEILTAGHADGSA